MIRNNPDKFPSGYVIELTNSEKEYVVKNFDHLETLKFSHATVKGFTEQGLYMLATILKSPMATATTIAIIDTKIKSSECSIETSQPFIGRFLPSVETHGA